MRVGFDANPLAFHAHRGIGQSTHCLVQALLGPAARAGGWQKGDSLLLCVAEGCASRLAALPPGMTEPAEVRPEELPALVRKHGLDLLHLNDYFFPLYRPEDVRTGALRPARLVLEVRDLYPLLFPDQNAEGHGRLTRHLLPVLEHVEAIVAISAWTKEELVHHLGVDADRVRVIHHGVDGTRFRPRPASALGELRRRYRLPRPFVLHVGALDRRKNHALLVRAFARFVREAPLPWDLVCAGPGRPRPELVREVERAGLEGRVRFLGPVPATDLPLLYAAAAVFAFPSLYEGFGNPVLEAMASGVPVLAARAASLPEVAGDAALLLDPADADAWADALLALAARPERRQALAAKGLARARRFTWEEAALRLLQLWREVLGSAAAAKASLERAAVTGARGPAPAGGADVAVVGCGRSGLPLALSLADAGLSVLGVETDPERRAALREGRLPFAEPGAAELLERTLGRTFRVVETITEAAASTATFVIAVNSPLDRRLLPSVQPVADLCSSLLALTRGKGRTATLLVRTTVPPGFSEAVRKLVQRRLGLAADGYRYAYCPDRTAPGAALDELRRLPQIVGARDEASAAAAADVFGHLGCPLILTRPLEAELAKLFNNAYRYVNFALANECLLLAEAVGADAAEALRAAREGYPRGAPPPPGFAAGPCLFKDGFFLAWDVPGTDLLLASWKINEGLADWLVRRVEQIRPLARPVILGAAYKEGSDDDRFAPGERLLRLLRARGLNPAVHDPSGRRRGGSPTVEAALEGAREVFVAVPDPSYRALSWDALRRLAAPGAVLADPWLLWGQPSAVTVL